MWLVSSCLELYSLVVSIVLPYCGVVSRLALYYLALSLNLYCVCIKNYVHNHFFFHCPCPPTPTPTPTPRTKTKTWDMREETGQHDWLTSFPPLTRDQNDKGRRDKLNYAPRPRLHRSLGQTNIRSLMIIYLVFASGFGFIFPLVPLVSRVWAYHEFWPDKVRNKDLHVDLK
jgi:hypothetical protein